MRIVNAAEIEELAGKGLVIRANFRRQNCDGLFYHLTLGSHVQSVSAGEATYREVDGLLRLGPGEVVNVEINEKFCLADAKGAPIYWGLIIAGARLLAGGVSHPATAIDPGFQHTTTLTLENLRNFPSQPFRVGQERIAKLLVLELARNELPEAWEETPAYSQSGPEEPPSVWPDVHLYPTWRPGATTTSKQLDELPELGPPFDVITAHLAEHRRLLSAGLDDQPSLPARVSELVSDATSVRTAMEEVRAEAGRMTRQVAEIEEDVKELESAFKDAEAKYRRESDARQSSLRESRRYWVLLLVTIATALGGGAVGAFITARLDDSSSAPSPSTTLAPATNTSVP
ncbi:MAG: hypothetical protein QOG94_3210 [Solirubrobacteraceae bacterium]|jgi:hypothetical protein|nr:hypothetical protein [Solirubrobacteraceae bacterium]